LRRKLKLELARVSQEAQGAPIRGTLVAAHRAAIALFIMFTFVVVRGNPGRSHSNPVAAAWLAAAVAAVVCGAIAVIPANSGSHLPAAPVTSGPTPRRRLWLPHRPANVVTDCLNATATHGRTN